MVRSVFDRIAALCGLLVLSPLFLLIALFISVDSPGGVFFIQQRVGFRQKSFGIYKFRTMRVDAESEGKLTIGQSDPRITKAGVFLRKYKLDELPQLINVLAGTMSLVGPRPEVQDYVAFYSPRELQVFRAKPGITDYASLYYFHESELLAQSDNPRQTYINEVMPTKLKMNLEYLERRTVFTDLKVIGATLKRMVS